MPTRRMIDPAIWQSESMASLTRDQRLLFIGLFSNADDQGRLRGSAHLIRSTIFPFDDIEVEEIKDDLRAIEAEGSIALYEVDGKEYIQVVHWWDYQSPQWAYPSKFPAMAGWFDRLRYRKDNSVITYNWKPDHSDYIPPPDSPDEPELPPKSPNGLPKSLPKDLPKPQGGPIELVLGLELEVENQEEEEETRARAKRHQDFGKVCKAYQYEIGGLSQTISDTIDDDLKLYPADWIIEAMKRSALANRRSYSYAQGILRNWQAIGGPQNDKPKIQKNGVNQNGHKRTRQTNQTKGSGEQPAIDPDTLRRFARKPT